MTHCSHERPPQYAISAAAPRHGLVADSSVANHIGREPKWPKVTESASVRILPAGGAGASGSGPWRSAGVVGPFQVTQTGSISTHRWSQGGRNRQCPQRSEKQLVLMFFNVLYFIFYNILFILIYFYFRSGARIGLSGRCR